MDAHFRRVQFSDRYVASEYKNVPPFVRKEGLRKENMESGKGVTERPNEIPQNVWALLSDFDKSETVRVLRTAGQGAKKLLGRLRRVAKQLNGEEAELRGGPRLIKNQPPGRIRAVFGGEQILTGSAALARLREIGIFPPLEVSENEEDEIEFGLHVADRDFY